MIENLFKSSNKNAPSKYLKNINDWNKRSRKEDLYMHGVIPDPVKFPNFLTIKYHIVHVKTPVSNIKTGLYLFVSWGNNKTLDDTIASHLADHGNSGWDPEPFFNMSSHPTDFKSCQATNETSKGHGLLFITRLDSFYNYNCVFAKKIYKNKEDYLKEKDPIQKNLWVYTDQCYPTKQTIADMKDGRVVILKDEKQIIDNFVVDSKITKMEEVPIQRKLLVDLRHVERFIMSHCDAYNFSRKFLDQKFDKFDKNNNTNLIRPIDFMIREKLEEFRGVSYAQPSPELLDLIYEKHEEYFPDTHSENELLNSTTSSNKFGTAINMNCTNDSHKRADMAACANFVFQDNMKIESVGSEIFLDCFAYPDSFMDGTDVKEKFHPSLLGETLEQSGYTKEYLKKYRENYEDSKVTISNNDNKHTERFTNERRASMALEKLDVTQDLELQFYINSNYNLDFEARQDPLTDNTQQLYNLSNEQPDLIYPGKTVFINKPSHAFHQFPGVVIKDLGGNKYLVHIEGQGLSSSGGGDTFKSTELEIYDLLTKNNNMFEDQIQSSEEEIYDVRRFPLRRKSITKEKTKQIFNSYFMEYDDALYLNPQLKADPSEEYINDPYSMTVKKCFVDISWLRDKIATNDQLMMKEKPDANLILSLFGCPGGVAVLMSRNVIMYDHYDTARGNMIVKYNSTKVFAKGIFDQMERVRLSNLSIPSPPQNLFDVSMLPTNYFSTHYPHGILSSIVIEQAGKIDTFSSNARSEQIASKNDIATGLTIARKLNDRQRDFTEKLSTANKNFLYTDIDDEGIVPKIGIRDAAILYNEIYNNPAFDRPSLFGIIDDKSKGKFIYKNWLPNRLEFIYPEVASRIKSTEHFIEYTGYSSRYYQVHTINTDEDEENEPEFPNSLSTTRLQRRGRIAANFLDAMDDPTPKIIAKINLPDSFKSFTYGTEIKTFQDLASQDLICQEIRDDFYFKKYDGAHHVPSIEYLSSIEHLYKDENFPFLLQVHNGNMKKSEKFFKTYEAQGGEIIVPENEEAYSQSFIIDCKFENPDIGVAFNHLMYKNVKPMTATKFIKLLTERKFFDKGSFYRLTKAASADDLTEFKKMLSNDLTEFSTDSFDDIVNTDFNKSITDEDKLEIAGVLSKYLNIAKPDYFTTPLPIPQAYVSEKTKKATETDLYKRAYKTKNYGNMTPFAFYVKIEDEYLALWEEDDEVENRLLVVHIPFYEMRILFDTTVLSVEQETGADSLPKRMENMYTSITNTELGNSAFKLSDDGRNNLVCEMMTILPEEPYLSTHHILMEYDELSKYLLNIDDAYIENKFNVDVDNLRSIGSKPNILSMDFYLHLETILGTGENIFHWNATLSFESGLKIKAEKKKKGKYILTPSLLEVDIKSDEDFSEFNIIKVNDEEVIAAYLVYYPDTDTDPENLNIWKTIKFTQKRNQIVRPSDLIQITDEKTNSKSIFDKYNDKWSKLAYSAILNKGGYTSKVFKTYFKKGQKFSHFNLMTNEGIDSMGGVLMPLPGIIRVSTKPVNMTEEQQKMIECTEEILNELASTEFEHTNPSFKFDVNGTTLKKSIIDNEKHLKEAISLVMRVHLRNTLISVGGSSMLNFKDYPQNAKQIINKLEKAFEDEIQNLKEEQ